METTTTISVLIVEDLLILRVGLAAALGDFPFLKVIGAVENGELAIEQALKLRPCVVLMDLGLPTMDGIEATKKIRELLPESYVLILTSNDNDEKIFAALSAGAHGYCLKDTSTTNLASAIQAVSQGNCWLDAAIAKRVFSLVTLNPAKERQSRSGAGTNHPKFGLTTREIDVLELLVEGLSNQEMSERLAVSTETIKTHMSRILAKLLVSDRTQAAIKAIREGLLG